MKLASTAFTPTHQLIDGSQSDVEAWQYQPRKQGPPWVLQSFFKRTLAIMSVVILEHYTERTSRAYPGDWIVRQENNRCTILTDGEFQRCFRPLATPPTP